MQKCTFNKNVLVWTFWCEIMCWKLSTEPSLKICNKQMSTHFKGEKMTSKSSQIKTAKIVFKAFYVNNYFKMSYTYRDEILRGT